MSKKITTDILEGYLSCKYKGHLRLAEERGAPTGYELLQREARERVRLAAADRLLTRNKGSEALRGVPVTPEVLKRSVPAWRDATLEAAGPSVRFDALQRTRGESRLGDFHCLPVLFHEAERPTRQLKALLELLGLLLGSVQGKDPATGVLIHGGACEV